MWGLWGHLEPFNTPLQPGPLLRHPILQETYMRTLSTSLQPDSVWAEFLHPSPLPLANMARLFQKSKEFTCYSPTAIWTRLVGVQLCVRVTWRWVDSVFPPLCTFHESHPIMTGISLLPQLPPAPWPALSTPTHLLWEKAGVSAKQEPYLIYFWSSARWYQAFITENRCLNFCILWFCHRSQATEWRQHCWELRT